MFDAPFEDPAINVKSPASFLLYKLLLTSRPYACATVNPEFFLLRREIDALANIEKFTTHNCKTEIDVQKACWPSLYFKFFLLPENKQLIKSILVTFV